jgi:acyl-CoA synthetase (AMP-forming)/AMP-acid ligase II
MIPRSPFEALSQAAQAHAEAPMLHIPPRDGADGVQRSYGEMRARVEALARRYAGIAPGPGRRVGLLLENTAHFFEHFLALNALGISVVPLDPDGRDAELRYMLEHAGVAFVVALERHRRRLAGIVGAMPVYDEALGGVSADGGQRPWRPEPVRPAECAVLYTSGTTGKPKGCLLDNDYFLRVGEEYVAAGGCRAIRAGAERLITPLPTFHVNALACSTMAMLLSGGCLVQLDRFHPRTWWRDARESRATIMHYLGVMPAMLLALPAEPTDRSHGIRFGFGANVDPAHHRLFESRFGIALIEAWAMTETAGAGTIATTHEPRNPGMRCIGRPSAGLDVRLVDDAGAEVAGEGVGELLVRSADDDPRAGFFRGYLADDEATEQAWRGGWFHTGDVVRRDAQGLYYFVDRAKNIVRRAGENIAALEVEAAILDFPGVEQAAVIATPDPVRGEEVLACVRVADGTRKDRDTALAIQRHCLQRLAYFKAPGHVVFVDTLPTTSTSKIRKRALSDLAAADAALVFDLREGKTRKALGEGGGA